MNSAQLALDEILSKQAYSRNSLRLTIDTVCGNQLTLRCQARASRSDPNLQRAHLLFSLVVADSGKNEVYQIDQFSQWRSNFVVDLTPGRAYNFTCSTSLPLTDGTYRPVAQASLYYHTHTHTHTPSVTRRPIVYRLDQMRMLLGKALTFLETKGPSLRPITLLYRNNPLPYFTDILENRGGIMNVCLKNDNGDPKCPINGKIDGIYFSCGVHPRTGKLPFMSPFGNTRFVIPIHKLIFPKDDRIYFADFFCHSKGHHVALVVTKPESHADRFCARTLPRLRMIEAAPSETESDDESGSDCENLFFHFNSDEGRFYCSVAVWVQIYYTENVNFGAEFAQNRDCIIQMGASLGRRAGYGRAKNPSCVDCNL